MERTFIMIKPDAVARGLAGEILSRIERKGMRIIGLKMIRINEQIARRQYAEHEGKEFYEPLIRFLCSAPVIVAVVEGKNSVAVTRKLIGATSGAEGRPGTIRGDLALSNRFNLIHGSDSPEKAAFEISLYFDRLELIAQAPAPWVYDLSGTEPV